MLGRFVVKAASVDFRATFAQPRFDVWRDVAVLYARLHEALRDHGARPATMRTDYAGGSLGDMKLQIDILAFASRLILSLESLAIDCFDLKRAQEKDVVAASTNALGALGEHLQDFRVGAYAIEWALHGTVSDRSGADIINHYVTQPPQASTRPHISTAILFSYGPEGAEQASSIMLEPSATVPDGLFVRLQTTLDAAKVDSLPAEWDRAKNSLLAHLGLALES